MQPSEWVDLLLDKAQQLRSAGVVSVSFDGCSAELRPPDPPKDLEPDGEEEEEFVPRRFRKYSEGSSA